ncbi:biosynthetic peptidoglycan transglycosylase [Nitratireductor aestuarii]|nr:transglycosylase domain-containing protein [Nitratireductor aestuarii]
MPTRTRFRASKRVWTRRVAKLLLLIVLVPLLLTLVYRPGFVHPVSTLMLADLVTFKGYDRRWVPLEEMGQVGPVSIMMSEDAKFCAHGGVDWGEMRAVVNDFMDGENPRGASTISMQTVKNLFLTNGRSFFRKAVEVPLALYFDAVMPKRRVMEIYLNIAEWGPGIYGLEAASQHYFGRPARDLTRKQAALLAVTLPNPLVRNPAKPSAQLSRLANRIERRARASGAYIGCIKTTG